MQTVLILAIELEASMLLRAEMVLRRLARK